MSRLEQPKAARIELPEDGLDAQAEAPFLSVRDLVAVFDTPEGPVRVVDALSFDLAPGRTLAIVGESGSGKSVLTRALVGLLSPGRVESGQILFQGQDLLRSGQGGVRASSRGAVSFIPQDVASSLDPLHSVGTQLSDAIAAHRRASRRIARRRAVEALRRVGVPGPESQARAYPHQLSAGMKRRVLLAMALVSEPQLLVADEPMTGLDAYSQMALLELLRRAQAERQMSIVLSTHDLGVVAELAHEVAIVYAGRLVEAGPTEAIFQNPLHPYTRTLIAAAWGGFVSAAPAGQRRLRLVEEAHAMVHGPVRGCRFESACAIARTGASGTEKCATDEPMLRVTDGTAVRCHLAEVNE